MDKKIVAVISDFNDTLLSLAINIANVCPRSVIGTNIKDIEKAIKKRDHFTKFIDLFSINVLQYKDEIDSGNDSFFLKKDYRDDLADQEESTFDLVASLKSIWGQLKKENRDVVIMNMQILCELSQEYFNYVKSSLDN